VSDHRSIRVLAFVVLFALIAACGSFGASSAGRGEGSTDGGTGSDGSGNGSDGATNEGGGTASYEPACPRPTAPSTACSADAFACSRRPLYKPSLRSHPHGVRITEKEVFWLSQPFGTAGYNGDAEATLWRLDRSTGEAVAIARALPRARLLVVHGAYVVWADQRSSSTGLWRLARNAPPCDASTCASPEPVMSGFGPPAMLESLSETVLLLLDESGTVHRIKLDDVPATERTVFDTTDLATLTIGDREAYVASALTPRVQRLSATGADAGELGHLANADGGTPFGPRWIATSCKAVFGFDKTGAVSSIPTSARGEAFVRRATTTPFDVYAIAADERFVYLGGANGGGLRRFDDTRGIVETLVPGASAWGMAVADRVLVYGEHGGSPSDPDADVGTIYVIDK
jgi:hypothetical protein